MSPTEFLEGLGRPVVIYPAMAEFIGINESLFITQFLYWADKGSTGDRWTYKTSDEIRSETALTYKAQALVRKKLISLNILEERIERLKHRMYYRINHEVVRLYWLDWQKNRTAPGSGNIYGSELPICPKVNSGDSGIPICPKVNSGDAQTAVRRTSLSADGGAPKGKFDKTESPSESSQENTSGDGDCADSSPNGGEPSSQGDSGDEPLRLEKETLKHFKINFQKFFRKDYRHRSKDISLLAKFLDVNDDIENPAVSIISRAILAWIHAESAGKAPENGAFDAAFWSRRAVDIEHIVGTSSEKYGGKSYYDEIARELCVADLDPDLMEWRELMHRFKLAIKEKHGEE